MVSKATSVVGFFHFTSDKLRVSQPFAMLPTLTERPASRNIICVQSNKACPILTLVPLAHEDLVACSK